MMNFKKGFLLLPLFVLTACGGNALQDWDFHPTKPQSVVTTRVATTGEVKTTQQQIDKAAKMSKQKGKHRVQKKDAKPTAVPETKRIDTTQCHDNDDWYLDGYRVGKSFKSQKQAMFTQRVVACGYQPQSLPAAYQQQWQRGFNIGAN